jgi:hypothetical protein
MGPKTIEMLGVRRRPKVEKGVAVESRPVDYSLRCMWSTKFRTLLASWATSPSP